MHKILVAVTAVIVSTAANAVTFTFDFKFDPHDGPADAPSTIPGNWSGTGVLTFDELTAAQATVRTATTAQYNIGYSLVLSGPDRTMDLSSTNGSAFISLDSPDPNFDNIFFRTTTSAGPQPYFMTTGYKVFLPNADLSAASLTAAVHSHFDNGSAANTAIYIQDGGNRFARITNFQELAAPVPEPGEWAMIAGGLAIVGGIARRRRSR